MLIRIDKDLYILIIGQLLQAGGIDIYLVVTEGEGRFKNKKMVARNRAVSREKVTLP